MGTFIWTWLFLAAGCVVLVVFLFRSSERQRWTEVAQAFSWIAIPVILGVSSWQIQSRMSESSIQKDYVQLAIDILRTPPPANAGVTPLRCWAMDVVERYAPVKLTDEEKSQLVRGGFGEGFGPGFSADSFAKGCPARRI